nr:hypothetical protein [Tanacetum cinerariifolium]
DEEVSSNDNEVTEVKALMALVDEARVFVGKKSVENEAWLNSSNKVNQCISVQIPTPKKKILGIDQLTEDTSNFGLKDLVFVKSSVDNSEVSIIGSNKPKLSKAKDSTLSKHDTSKSVAPLPPLEKLTGAEHVSGPKTIKSIQKSKSTFKAKTLKGITINEPSSALVSGNKSSLAFKTNSAPAGKKKLFKLRKLSLSKQYNIRESLSCLNDYCSKHILPAQIWDVTGLEGIKPFTRSPNMYKEYLAEFWYSDKALGNSKVFFSTPTGGIYGEVEVNTFRNAIGAHCVSHSSEYIAPPSIDIVRPWFETIRMHKEDKQATGGPTPLGVTSEAKANPQLSSGNDASIVSTAEVDLGKSTPSDFVPQQQGWSQRFKPQIGLSNPANLFNALRFTFNKAINGS